MDMTVPILAVCGLLYSMVATDPKFSDKIRSEADRRATTIAEVTVERGYADSVAQAAYELSVHIKDSPRLADSLAVSVGPECKKLSGGERM